MKKAKQLGFALIETLVVSVFITGVLIYLYIQFQAIHNSYEESFEFNPVPALYAVNNMSQYLVKNELSTVRTTIVSNLATAEGHYVDITNCNFATSDTSKNYCKELVKRQEIKQLLVVEENMIDFRTYVKENHPFSGSFEQFIQKLDVANVKGQYRLLAEFTNGQKASIKMNLDQ